MVIFLSLELILVHLAFYDNFYQIECQSIECLLRIAINNFLILDNKIYCYVKVSENVVIN